jgi:peptide/nickel transport system substrate-binding protein
MKKVYILLFFLILAVNCNTLTDDKVIIESLDAFPHGLDPARNFDPEEVRVYSNIYESLLTLDSDYRTVQPNLAESWEISEDNKEYRFHLRPGIRFHDGSPLTSDVAIYSFQRQANLNPSSPLFNMIESFKEVDSLTFMICLKYPYAQFLYTLSSVVGLKAVSKNGLDKFGDNISFHPVGTGPLQLDEWETNSHISLIPFDEHRAYNRNSNKVIFKYFSDYFDQEEEFRSGNIDIQFAVIGYSIDRLKWLGLADYKFNKPISTVFIGFNNRSDILTNRKLRKAILFALNIPYLVHNILRGNSVVARGPLPPIFFDYQESCQEGYNYQKSINLLREAGYSKGLSLKFYYLNKFRARDTVFLMLKNELEKVQIDINLIPFYSREELNNACRSDSAQIFWMGWESDVLGDPENFLYSLFYSKSEYNFLNYRQPQVDQWLEAARREFDNEKRQVIYRNIIKQILDDTPAVFLYHVIPLYAYNRYKIKYLPVDPYGIIQYHQIVFNN